MCSGFETEGALIIRIRFPQRFILGFEDSGALVIVEQGIGMNRMKVPSRVPIKGCCYKDSKRARLRCFGIGRTRL